MKQLDEAIARHRDTLACTIGSMAALLAYDIDCKGALVMQEIAQADNLTETIQTLNKYGVVVPKEYPQWALMCFLHGRTFGPHHSMTASAFTQMLIDHASPGHWQDRLPV